jgi:hypothetical protein
MMDSIAAHESAGKVSGSSLSKHLFPYPVCCPATAKEFMPLGFRRTTPQDQSLLGFLVQRHMDSFGHYAF